MIAKITLPKILEFQHLFFVPLMLLAALGLADRANAQGTAFTYEGRLNTNGSPVTGSFDLQCALFSDATLNLQVGSATNILGVGITNGIFLVTLDFGPNIFVGEPVWLDIGVRSNGSSAGFTALGTRQPVTPTPYAIFAGSAAQAASATIAASVSANAITSDGIQDSAITAAKLASGQVVKTINGLSDNVSLSAGANITLTMNGHSIQVAASGGTSSGWALGGNLNTGGGNYLGTGDNVPLELRVNNARALRLVPTTDSPNVIGGANINSVASGAQGATVGGGGSIATYGTPYPNIVAASHGTISGGLGNTIRTNAYESAIAGGNQNLIDTNASRSAIGGGFLNFIQIGSSSSTIGGGYVNTIQTNSFNSTIGGGSGNVIQLAAPSSTVAGGANNVIQPNASGAAIGGGLGNMVGGIYSTVAGGQQNTVGANNSVVGGGNANSATNIFTTISGGNNNIAGGPDAAVGGGQFNSATGSSATIPGGSGNSASGVGSFSAGVNAHVTHNHSFVWGDGTQAANSTGANRFEVLATGGISLYGDAGNVNIAAPADINFGFSTRQMLNLFDTTYGIGVQNFTLYQRTSVNGGFAWYAGGAHTNAQNNAGGGATLMTLDSAGNLGVKDTLSAATVAGSAVFNDGISGVASYGRGVYGEAMIAGANYAGVWGENPAPNGTAMVAKALGSGSTGIYASGTQWAGYFDGPVTVCSLTIRGGCDVAEPFQMSHEEIPKGSVVVIDDENPGQLKLSDRPYDSRVAGIVSGANGVNPGISMSQEGILEGGRNVALSGRVYVLADASNGAIKPGDLLTTSTAPGHAMKATNRSKAQGATLGKAMSSLPNGQGMVLVLVTLQ